MSMQRKGKGLQEIDWKCLVLGDSYPKSFNGGQWISPPRQEYPLDIVLGLEKISNIYKVVIEVNEQYVPSKIELALGLGENVSEKSYRTARAATFSDPISMEFGIHQKMNPFPDTAGQYLWLVVYEPLKLKDNAGSRVGINKLTVIGYILDDNEVASIEFRPTSTGSTSGKQSRPSSKSSSSSLPRSSTPQSQNPPLGPYSNNDDGESTGGPIADIRAVKRVLTKKMEKAQEKDHPVNEMFCLRAIQRLSEYEAMIEELSQKRHNALVHNKTEQAERLRLAMIDCRDNAFRAINIDILLGQQEIREIGLNSSWTSKS
ncbi:hypothetical protein V3C99_013443 [Haemonchus contortus]